MDTTNLTNKRKEEVITSEEAPATKKLSREARKRRNKRLKWECEHGHEQNERSYIPEEKISPVTVLSTELNITFDPSRHRTQFATRGLCISDKIYYIEDEWTSTPLFSSDRVSSKEEKTRHDITTQDLLIETLIREARSNDTGEFEIVDIPSDFLTLVDTDIISSTRFEEPLFCNNGLSTSDRHLVTASGKKKRLWISLGQWLGMKAPIRRRDVREHLRLRWKKLQHAMDIRNNQDSSILVPVHHTRKKRTQLIASARDIFQSLDRLVGFRYVVKPECITDMNGRTLIHLEQLDDQIAVTQAIDAVNRYYFHTLNNPSHRSDGFWENFIEHFGAYTLYNILPYTSSNTASLHNIDHLECVNNLLCELAPLSDSINRFIEIYYKSLYEKLSKLKWGVFSPRSFGIFPMIAINFNTMSDYHWDEHDEPNSLCCLVALGDFEGGELCFPQLQIIVPLRPGQVVAFSSRLLLHGNFPITRGIRHSIVYFVHSMFFHHLRNFSSVYTDLENGIERDAHGSIVSMIPRQDLNDARNPNNLISPPQPKKSRTELPDKASDKRRGNIDLTRARRGLKAEDPIPDES